MKAVMVELSRKLYLVGRATVENLQEEIVLAIQMQTTRIFSYMVES